LLPIKVPSILHATTKYNYGVRNFELQSLSSIMSEKRHARWFSRSRGGKVDAFGARLLIGQFLLKLGHIKINSLPELRSFTTISWYFKYYVSDCLMYDVKSDLLGASQAITLLFKSCL